MKTTVSLEVDIQMKNKPHLHITYLEAEGSTLDELLDNGRVSIENGRGYDLPALPIGDLDTPEYNSIESMLKEHLGEVAK